MAYDFKKEYRHLRTPEIVTVPKINYVSVRGKGNPNEEGGEYQLAIKILYAVSYTLKMSKKMDYIIESFYDYVVPPLEGFWDWKGCNADKSSMKWIAVMRLPEFITVNEGLCVQALHVGAFDDEPLTVALMDKYIHERGLVNDIAPHRLHHEIYLSDARKVSPEKRRTVIRHPVKS